MFRAADLVLVNKTDLLPYVDFDVGALTERARSLHPGVTVLPLSVRTGDGTDDWYAPARPAGQHPHTSRRSRAWSR